MNLSAQLGRLNPVDPRFDLVLAAMAGLILIMFLWTLATSIRLGSIHRRYRQLLDSPSGANMEELLREYFMIARDAREIAGQSGEKADHLVGTYRNCLQRVGVVRFDAFNDTSGQLSFSLAMADDPGNGLVLTSVHGREGCRVYAKSLKNGESEAPLSSEEREAVKQAMSAATPSVRDRTYPKERA